MSDGLFLKNDKKNDYSDNEKENKISKKAIIVLIFFGIALIYTIVMLLKANFTKPTVFYKNNIEQYTTSENLLVSDYFYTVDLQIANFLEAVDREMYDDLYNILSNDYKKIYSKSEIVNKLKEYRENVFKYDKIAKYTEHVQNVYKLPKDMYLVQLDFNNNDFYLVLTSGMRGYNFTIVE